MNYPLFLSFLSHTQTVTQLTSALRGLMDREDLGGSNSPEKKKTEKLRSHDFQSMVYFLEEIMQTVCTVNFS